MIVIREYILLYLCNDILFSVTLAKIREISLKTSSLKFI